MDKVTEYRMTKTMDMANLKEIIGQTVKVDEIKTNHYTAVDGSEHTVLAILLDNGKMYRTEARAFIDDMINFIDTFDDKTQRPCITIQSATSRKGNAFIKFVVNA